MKSIKAIGITVAALYSSVMPRSKEERRILSYYNPETDKKPNRNSVCPCGSGNKFKKCCIVNK